MTLLPVIEPAFQAPPDTRCFDEAAAAQMERFVRAFDPAIVDTFLAHPAAIDALRCKITQECPSFDALIDAP